MFVGGASAGGTGYIFSSSVGDLSALANAPRTDVHALALTSAGSARRHRRGIWSFSGVWTNITGNLATAAFNAIVSDPTNPNKVFGGTVGGGTSLYTGNQSWTQVLGPSAAASAAIDRHRSQCSGAGQPNIIYQIQAPAASGIGGGTSCGSLDGGTTWAAMPARPTAPRSSSIAVRASLAAAPTQVFNPLLNTWSQVGGPGIFVGVPNRQGASRRTRVSPRSLTSA